MLVILLIGEWGQGVPFRQPLWQKPSDERGKFYQLLSEEEKVGLGCCLIPTAGCIMGYYSLKKDTSKVTKERRVSIGINYSLGLAIGHDYWRSSGEMINPRKVLYWVNRLGMTIGYTIKPHLELEAGFGYMWGREKNRITPFDYIKNGHRGDLTDGDWNISAFTPMFLVKFAKKNKFLKLGFEWYFAKGINYSYKIIEPYPYQYEEIVINTNGTAPGGILGMGYTPDLLSFLKLEFSIVGRYGLVRNPNYWSTEEVIRSENNSLCFVGLYLQLGVKYNLLTQKGGTK